MPTLRIKNAYHARKVQDELFLTSSVSSDQSSTNDTFNEHVSLYKKRKITLSNIGEKQLKQKSVKVHLSNASNRKHSCEICSQTFSSKRNLKTHLPIHEKLRPNKCDICGKQFSLANNLKKHMLIHGEGKVHSCTVCGKNFSRISNLKTHLKIHEGKRPHSCKICGKQFIQKSNFSTHILIHSGSRPHKCDVCSKQFTQVGNLRTHLMVHEGIRPHACKVCGKRFTQKGNLDIHYLVHSGIKPQQCKKCGKRFKQKSHVDKHLKICSKVNISKISDFKYKLEQPAESEKIRIEGVCQSDKQSSPIPHSTLVPANDQDSKSWKAAGYDNDQLPPHGELCEPKIENCSFTDTTNVCQSDHNPDRSSAKELLKLLDLESTGNDVSSSETIFSEQDASSVNEPSFCNLFESFESENDKARFGIIEQKETDNRPPDFASVEKSYSLKKEQDCSQAVIASGISDLVLRNEQISASNINYCLDSQTCDSNSLFQVKLFLKIYLSESPVNEDEVLQLRSLSEVSLNESSVSIKELVSVY